MKFALIALIAMALPATSALAQPQDRRAEAEDILRQLFAPQTQAGWQIGPIVRGRNYSPGMAPRAAPYGSGFTIDVPTRPDHHVHYVTRPIRSLAGARSITVRMQIDAAPGTRFIAQAKPHEAPTMSLYFQRAGDNWSARDRYRYYRWYAPADKMIALGRGRYEVTVSLDDPRWIAVSGGATAANARQQFEAAKANAARVGVVFGSAGLRGHGVYASAPARITITDFNIR